MHRFEFPLADESEPTSFLMRSRSGMLCPEDSSVDSGIVLASSHAVHPQTLSVRCHGFRS